ncbi:PREDICTED: uncharacterized protein LOC109585517 [Amphimedon queenslandica]|uniref:Uncharacterized protein n=1 Tax=Amphimedon queenslandica TaxID=400682 RepID=A0A1X7TXN4_AMPQE|nr:PREDICTED: uncharacterized protein LOC109585517 [Amphimedon queenslandica]|eukprot:XP_019857206.1 PREDICTED: uncharacterized protein LOC109585517 [Amphimedon queenslandica]
MGQQRSTPRPAEGLDPMLVTPEVTRIAEKMKKDAEWKLEIKQGYTTYAPLSYIKKGKTDYCIRVKVDDDQLIDVCGQYLYTGSVMRVKAKHVTHYDDQIFF